MQHETPHLSDEHEIAFWAGAAWTRIIHRREWIAQRSPRLQDAGYLDEDAASDGRELAHHIFDLHPELRP